MPERDVPNKERSADDRARHAPSRPVLPPLPARHSVNHLRGNSHPKRRNTLVDPSVDMAWETELIRQGFADSIGNSRYRINGRVYVHEAFPKTRLYPESGPGVENLTRNAFAALTLLIRCNGYTVEAENEITRTPQFTDDVVATAKRWFDRRTRK